MELDKIRAMNAQELNKQIDDAYQELFNLRLRHATRQLENYSELGKVRKKIATLKTLHKERELAGK